MPKSPRTRRRRPTLGPRIRRALAAALAAIVVGAGLTIALTRPGPGAVPVVVSTGHVQVGQALDGALEVRLLPADVLPEGALTELSEAGGRHAASVLAPGEIVTGKDLHLPSLLADRAFFLPIGEGAVLRLLSSGDQVDVHSPVDGRVVVDGVTVVAVEQGEEGGAWLAVSREESTDLATARGQDPAGAHLVVTVRHPESSPTTS